MAEFCNACARKLGLREGDFKGLTTPEAWEKQMAVVVICEGCGFIQVDPEGNCATTNCLCAGEEGHGILPPGLEDASSAPVEDVVPAEEPADSEELPSHPPMC